MAPRTGGQVLVDALLARGVGTVFCVPGESFLGALDALYGASDRIRLISCRHEGGAANMAEAYGKLTGRPGICFVTRGPGATHASIGLHTARQDSTPMILFIGQVGSGMLGREAFQEIDYRRMFGEVTKWVDQVDDPDRIPEYLARAWNIAMSGRKGPVALVMPEDVLTAETGTADIPPQPIAEPAPGPEQMREVGSRLGAARRPLMIVGGSGWSPAVRGDMTAFAEKFGLPVAAGFRCQDRMDNTHPLYVGELGTSVTPELARRVKDSDLLLVAGERLGEMTTSGYTLLSAPDPKQRLIHVHAGAEELGKVYRADLPINAAVGPFFAAARQLPASGEVAWRQWAANARQDFENALKVRAFPGRLDFGEIMRCVRDRLGPDAIVTNGAGNFTGWPQRHYLFRTYPTQLAPVSGAMGYGVPAALAAKAVHPDREVVCFAGDGCFLMSSQELSTAVLYGLNVVILVLDNGMYGTIRMHQERRYPGRITGTTLHNPDFARYAQSFGAHGERVEVTEEFAPAFDRALAAGKPAVIHLVMDPEVLGTRMTLSEVREQGLARSGRTAAAGD